MRELCIGVPFDRLGEVIGFYTEVLGLRPWPRARQIPGGWGAGDARRGVYFQFRHDPVVDPMRRRCVLSVTSLEELGQRLSECPWPFVRRRGLGPYDESILTNDPTGHRLEVRQFQPL